VPHLQEVSEGFQGPAHPDESCVEPALYPAQRLNHAPEREGTSLRCGGATCVTPPSRLSTVFSEKHSRQDQVSHQVCGFQGCAFSCLALAEMRRHKKEEHRGKKGFSCDKCEKPFPNFPQAGGPQEKGSQQPAP